MTKENIIFEEIKKLVDKKEPVIIAIDGRCGSGKTSLAAKISEKFDCNVFHMDDFFLPFEMKTKKRLAEPGGNVHYERFEEEVLKWLLRHENVSYRQYSCSKGALGEPIYVGFKNFTIVEGSYSMHPVLRNAYDYSIFLTHDKEVQLERIRRRNGEEKLKAFLDKWIPLEEHYFSALDIQAQCNVIFDTTDIFK